MFIKFAQTFLFLSIIVIATIGVFKDSNYDKLQMVLTVIFLCLIPLDIIFIILTIWF